MNRADAGAIVRDVRVAPLDVPLLSPFGIAGGTHEEANNLLVTVELADGTLGFGEAAPLPAFNGETQAGARAALAEAREAVLGTDARRWRRSAAAIAEAAPASGAAKCALETALLDAATRRAGVSLRDFFGGVETELESDITIPIAGVEEAAEGARRAASAGFRTLKIKVGGDPSNDVARVLAVIAAAPGAGLMLDGNAGLDVATAVDLVASARRAGAKVVLFEQPTRGGDDAALAQVARRADVLVAADEDVTSAADVVRLARRGDIGIINIKAMKSGVAEALSIAVAARAHGLGLMIGGMVETRLAMGLSACLAAGLGGFAFIDLDTPLFLADDPFEGGYSMRGPVLDLGAVDAGHGARPRGLGASPR